LQGARIGVPDRCSRVARAVVGERYLVAQRFALTRGGNLDYQAIMNPTVGVLSLASVSPRVGAGR